MQNRRTVLRGCATALGLGCAAPSSAGMLERLFGAKDEKEVIPNDAPEALWKWSTEALHYRRVEGNVQCQLCPNECTLPPRARSRCKVRVNIGNKLYSLVYGNPASVHVDPIEKKPLYHFLPATPVFSMGFAGCNFGCLNCQNWEISQRKPEELNNYSLFPDEAVAAALKSKSISVAYTYNEPTVVYEFMLETARKARSAGLRNVWVTNGSMKREPLEEFCKYLDAANVDLKSFSDETYHTLNFGALQPVLDTLLLLKDKGVWFEITTLIVPTYTDDPAMIRAMCKWIRANLGPDYPLHFSRFHPEYRLEHLPPTPPSRLEAARKVAIEEGLHYVYIGNYRTDQGSNTCCPQCGAVVVERIGFTITRMALNMGNCARCGRRIAGRWTV